MATKQASPSTSSKSKKEIEKKKKAEDKHKEKEKKQKRDAKAAAAASAAQAADATALAKEKLKKRGGGKDDVEDDEVEEQAIEMMGGAEVDADAQKDQDQEEPIGERKEVQDLIAQGKQKGFVTFDEVNDALPGGDAVSTEQIDDVMSMFGDNDIEVVDAQKQSEGTVEVKPTVAAEEDAAVGDVLLVGQGGGVDGHQHDVMPLPLEFGGEGIVAHAGAAIHVGGSRGDVQNAHQATVSSTLWKARRA